MPLCSTQIQRSLNYTALFILKKWINSLNWKYSSPLIYCLEGRENAIFSFKCFKLYIFWARWYHGGIPAFGRINSGGAQSSQSVRLCMRVSEPVDRRLLGWWSLEYKSAPRGPGSDPSRRLVIFCLAFVCVVGVTLWGLEFHYADAVLSLASL